MTSPIGTKKLSLNDQFLHGLERFRQGIFFTEFDLSETVELLPASGALPDPDDSAHPFNILLRAIATEIVKDDVVVAKNKRQHIKFIEGRLQRHRLKWSVLIRESRCSPEDNNAEEEDNNKMESQDDTEQMEVEEDKAKEDKNDKAIKKRAVSKKRKLAEEDAIEEIKDEDIEDEEIKDEEIKDEEIKDEEIDDEEIEDENSELFRVVKDKKYFERKATFEVEREEVLSGVPDHVKERFGQIFYAKWSSQTLPVLLLNPYSVPPGPMRHEWFAMFDKVS
jgi:hypothetical protein